MNINLNKMIFRRKVAIAMRVLLATAFALLGAFALLSTPAEAARDIKRANEVFLYEARTEGDTLVARIALTSGFRSIS